MSKARLLPEPLTNAEIAGGQRKELHKLAYEVTIDHDWEPVAIDLPDGRTCPMVQVFTKGGSSVICDLSVQGSQVKVGALRGEYIVMILC